MAQGKESAYSNIFCFKNENGKIIVNNMMCNEIILIVSISSIIGAIYVMIMVVVVVIIIMY